MVDINVVLDVVLDREVDGASVAVMNSIDRGKAQGFLSATSCATIYYLANKYLDHDKAISLVKDLLKIFKSFLLTQGFKSCTESKVPDFER